MTILVDIGRSPVLEGSLYCHSQQNYPIQQWMIELDCFHLFGEKCAQLLFKAAYWNYRAWPFLFLLQLHILAKESCLEILAKFSEALYLHIIGVKIKVCSIFFVAITAGAKYFLKIMNLGNFYIYFVFTWLFRSSITLKMIIIYQIKKIGNVWSFGPFTKSLKILLSYTLIGNKSVKACCFVIAYCWKVCWKN